MSSFETATAKAAALTRWANEPDTTAATAPARAGFMKRFEDQVEARNPGLAPDDRRKRAERLMRAHMITIAQKRKKSPTTKP